MLRWTKWTKSQGLPNPPFVGVWGEVVDADIGVGVAGGAQEGEDGEQGQQLGHAAHQDDPGPVVV